MIIISGTMEVGAEHVEAAKENFRKAGEATRQEDGCIAYAFWQSVDAPHVFRVYEEWEDKDALRAHAQHPNMAAHRERMAPLGVTNRQLKMVEPSRIKDL